MVSSVAASNFNEKNSFIYDSETLLFPITNEKIDRLQLAIQDINLMIIEDIVEHTSDVNNKISFCFTHKNRLSIDIGDETLPLFKNCLLTLRSCLDALGISDYEIIVSSWDNDKEFLELHQYLLNNFSSEKITLTRIDLDGFSRGLGLNRAGQASIGNIIGFIDTDMLFVRTPVITKGIECTLQNVAYFPTCYTLDEDGSGWWRPTGYGNCFVSRRIFDTVQWVEKFSWGAEDEMFVAGIKEAGYHFHRDNCAGWHHQWHPDDQNVIIKN